jgi:proprotein convertase subtilisin/kexin type 5
VTCSSFSVCQTCNSALLRSLVGTSCTCDAGYYDNNVNLVCQPCHYTCGNCFAGTSTSCFTCGTNRQYVLGTYSCPCRNGFYESLQVCYSCDSTCLTCSNIDTNCTSCDTSIRYLSNSQCLCNTGYYQNGASCSPCDIRCQSCITSPTNCLSCNPSFLTVLVGNTCQCIPGQYQNITSLVCLPCHIKCQTCTSNLEITCLTCNPLSHRTISGTSCLCNVGYYDTGAATCASCDATCYSCYGLTKYNCSQCYPGDIMMGSTCVTPVVCTTGFYYGGSCITTCPNTTYGNSNICILC